MPTYLDQLATRLRFYTTQGKAAPHRLREVAKRALVARGFAFTASYVPTEALALALVVASAGAP